MVSSWVKDEFEKYGEVYVSTEDGSVGTKGNVMDAIRENGLEAEIDLAGARCEGKCVSGPNITINGVEYTEVDEEKLKQTLDELVKVK